jgi:hypothetical protein
LGYLTGGVVFNGLVLVNNEATAATSVAVNTFAAGNVVVVVYWVASLLPKIDFQLEFRDLLWSVLEFEEGREIGGLLILLLHVLRLRGFLQEGSDKKAVSRGGGGWMGTLGLVGVLSGAVYLWVYYQPEMNSRYQTEHCDGQFATGSGETNEEL